MTIYDYLEVSKNYIFSKIKEYFKNLSIWNIVSRIVLKVSPSCAFQLNNFLTGIKTISF